MRRSLAVAVMVWGTACGGPSPESTDLSFFVDAGPTDAADNPDTGQPDAGRADATDPDAGSLDAGAADTGAPDATPHDTGSLDAGAADSGPPDAGAPLTCVRTLCMAGAFTRSDGANPDFRDLCERRPGLVLDGSETLFLFSATDAAKDALINALDTNQDQRVDAQDMDCDVHLLGYSWGGVNTTNLGQAFVDDARVAPARAHIERMVVIDPYSPVAGRTIEVPAQVQQFWAYRHSISPAGDCSGAAPLGPYEGLPPLCAASSRCRDYDFSLAPSTVFTGLFSSWSGQQVGHCTVVDAAGPAVLHNLDTGLDFPSAPPSVPVGAR